MKLQSHLLIGHCIKRIKQSFSMQSKWSDDMCLFSMDLWVHLCNTFLRFRMGWWEGLCILEICAEMHANLHIKYLLCLFDFNKYCNGSTVYHEFFSVPTFRESPSSSSGVMCRQIDRQMYQVTVMGTLQTCELIKMCLLSLMGYINLSLFWFYIS